LISTDFFDEGVVDIIDILLEGVDVFGADKFVVFGLEQSHCVPEVCCFILVRVIQHVIILD
jgi:hypothetical protein